MEDHDRSTTLQAKIRSRFRTHLLPVVSCLVVALLISLLPYYLWGRSSKGSSLVFIHDSDNFAYLQIAAQAYYNHPWYLTDPVLPTQPVYYPWLQFVPAILAARTLGLGALGVNLVWHLWAAIGLALGFYCLFWKYLKSSAWAAACAIFVLSDCGLDTFHPLVRQFWLVTKILAGHIPALVLQQHPILEQWRITDPAVGLPFLLLHVWLLARARDEPKRFPLALSGLGFGLVFYVYFYFWTAAVAGLAIAFLLDSAGRKTYLNTFWIGCLIGWPAVAHGLFLRSVGLVEAVQRFSVFLPMPRLAYPMIPRLTIALMVITYLWIRRERKAELLYPWSLGVAGLLLNNSHLITALDMQEGHFQYVWGPASEIALVILVAGYLRLRLDKRRLFAYTAAGALALYAVSGLFLERFEVLHYVACRKAHIAYHKYTLQARESKTVPFLPRSVVGGARDYENVAVIAQNLSPLNGEYAFWSPRLDNDEWAARVALDDILQGMERADFKAWATDFAQHYPWGPWAYGEASRQSLAALLIRKYDEVSADPLKFMRRFGVRYVAEPKGNLLPLSVRPQLRLIQRGPFWTIWERKTQLATSPAPQTTPPNFFGPGVIHTSPKGTLSMRRPDRRL